MGDSESDDTQAAAAIFFLLNKDANLWAIEIVENEDGSISPAY
jgi:hypothetical protein